MSENYTWWIEQEHDERMKALQIESDYKLFEMLKPSLYEDGNQWCCLYGKDIQVGIVGFGDTPYQAILDFNKSFHQKNLNSNQSIK